MVIGPLLSLFVASFMLMKKHGFDILQAISWRSGEKKLELKPNLAQVTEHLELQHVSENRNVQDEEESPNQYIVQSKVPEGLPSVDT